NMLVANNLNPLRRLELAEVDGLADFEAGDVHENLVGQIFWQATNFDLVKDVLQHSATGFNARGFAAGFNRDMDGDVFVRGNFVKINMEHLAVERMVLDILDESETLV